MNEDYIYWWWEEGSNMRPQGNEDTEEFSHRMTQIAWSNGKYKAIAECIKRAEAYSYMSPNFSVLADEFRNMLNE